MKTTTQFLLVFMVMAIVNCSKDDDSNDSNVNLFQNQDPIAGEWFLVTVNDIDVSDLDCYKDSYIKSDGAEITFFLMDQEPDGSCEVVLNNTTDITNQEGFYYLGDEAIEFYIEENELTWRVDIDNTLIFQK